MNTDDVRYIERHLTDAGRVELRVLHPGSHVVSGLFDNAPPLVSAIHDMRQVADMYYTAQAPSLRCVPNRMCTGALGNDDIASYVRIVFDLDTVREKGQAATDLQIEAAGDLVDDITKFLYREDWPRPVVIFSGNGYHMIYRTPPIPNTDEYKKTLKQLYDGLAREFSRSVVRFDTSVQNAGRIMRVPGSYNLKVPDVVRMCEVQTYPRRWHQVQLRHIETVAQVLGQFETVPQVQPHKNRQAFIGSGDYSTLDIVAWFQAHGHYIRPAGTSSDGAPAHGVRCPWVNEHTSSSPPTGSDTVIFESDGGWPGFFCHHDHCSGRTIGDVLQAWGDADVFCARAYAGRVS